MKLRKLKNKSIYLVLMVCSVLTGQTLEDISIVDSENSYFLTLTFDEAPRYNTSEVYEPPSFTINFSGTKWEKGDFARRVMTDPLYQYSIKVVTNSFGREDLELRLDFFANTEVKINESGNKRIIVSWDKFKETGQEKEQRDSTEIEFSKMSLQDALLQTVSMQFRDATVQDVVRLLTTSYAMNVVLHRELLETGRSIPISLSLNNVTIQSALDIILKINGYDWYLDGEIIVVKPVAEVFQGELLTKIYELKFADGAIIASALANGILSTKGTSA
ncbi:uncharacterized protein METZ01_LOCUS202256, partial [marine metagenome]